MCVSGTASSEGARAAGDHRGPKSLNAVKVEGTTGIDSSVGSSRQYDSRDLNGRGCRVAHGRDNRATQLPRLRPKC